MSQALFFRGHDSSPQRAVRNALMECADILLTNPSLIVQLEAVSPMGEEWDADIRILGLNMKEAAGGGKRSHRSQDDPAANLNMKNPEHAKSGNPNEWRPAGMKHDGPPAAFRFGNAALCGEVPEIPLQDIEIPNYELLAASEPELKRILLEAEERRRRANEKLSLEHE